MSQNVDLPCSSRSEGDRLIWGDDSTDHVSDTDSEDSPIIKRLKPGIRF